MTQNAPKKENWFKSHPKVAIAIPLFCIVVAAAITLYLFSIPIAAFTLLSSDATRVIIETDATILGFFGLIAIYLFTSYDNRIDKLEDKILDPANSGQKDELQKRQNLIISTKKYAMITIIVGLGCLVVSMFLSIASYGVLSLAPDVNATAADILSLQAWQIHNAAQPTIIAILLLLISVLSIFVMLVWIGVMSPSVRKKD